MGLKQAIVMRRDLKMRRGKEIAQGAHASMAFLTRRIQKLTPPTFTLAEWDWITGDFTKVCVRVDSEEELLRIHDEAKTAGLEAHLITDLGKTEFHGQPTHTCLAIGPDKSEKIDAITGDLKLL